MSPSLTVQRLSTTPVKGLALHHPEHLDLADGRVVGDREFFLVDANDELISCTDIGDLMRVRASYDAAAGRLSLHGPDGELHSAVVEHGEPFVTDFYGLRAVEGHVVAGWDDVVSRIGGQPLRLVHGATGGFDVAGVTLLGTSSTDDVTARNGAAEVDGRRFRMNVEIAGARPHDEDSWDGRHVRIGEVVLRAGGQVKRCAATTRDPDTGVVDLQTLRMIGVAKGRQSTPEFGDGFYLGIYADVVTPGRIRLGDEVELLA
jgi:uncharacterized protein YcbX